MRRQRRNQRTQKTKRRPNDRLPRALAPTRLRDGSNGFPAVQRVILTFESQITLNPGAAVAQYTYRGNSLFDPDYTGTGGQPRYFDTYSTVYGKYRVLGSRIMVDIINGSPTAACSMAVLPWTDPITFTSWARVSELPQARVSRMVPIASRITQRLTHATSTSAVCGLRNRQVMDEDWAATVGSNPLQIWYWNVCVASVDTSTSVAASIRVRLEYDSEFYDRSDPGLSIISEPEKGHVKQDPDPPFTVFNQVMPVSTVPSLGVPMSPSVVKPGRNPTPAQAVKIL